MQKQNPVHGKIGAQHRSTISLKHEELKKKPIHCKLCSAESQTSAEGWKQGRVLSINNNSRTQATGIKSPPFQGELLQLSPARCQVLAPILEQGSLVEQEASHSVFNASRACV
jgi:hypothetical protein